VHPKYSNPYTNTNTQNPGVTGRAQGEPNYGTWNNEQQNAPNSRCASTKQSCSGINIKSLYNARSAKTLTLVLCIPPQMTSGTHTGPLTNDICVTSMSSFIPLYRFTYFSTKR
jgi:hypothetical protein